MRSVQGSEGLLIKGKIIAEMQFKSAVRETLAVAQWVKFSHKLRRLIKWNKIILEIFADLQT